MRITTDHRALTLGTYTVRQTVDQQILLLQNHQLRPFWLTLLTGAFVSDPFLVTTFISKYKNASKTTEPHLLAFLKVLRSRRLAAASDSLSAVFVLPFFFQLFKLCPIIPHTSYRCCSGSVACLVGRFFLLGTSTGQRYALFPCQSSLLPTVLIVKQFPGSQPCQWWPTGKPSSAASGYFFFFAKKSPLLYAVLGVYWPSPSPPSHSLLPKHSTVFTPLIM